MNYRRALLVTALLLGMVGCAGYSDNTRSDLRYQDGSYYSAADADYGDYYYAPEPRDDYYTDRTFFYGSPFYSSAGYCSARYRYCPPFGYGPSLDSYGRFGFIISSGGYGGYDPFWGPYGYQPSYPVHHHHRHAPDAGNPPPAPLPQAGYPGSPIGDNETGPRSGARRPRPDPMAEDLQVTEESAVDADAQPRVRQRWRGSVPVMPAPADSTVRMRYPALPPPMRREFPAPEARQRRDESTQSTDSADSAEDNSAARPRSGRRDGSRKDPQSE